MPGREGRGEEKWDLEGCRDEAREWEPVSGHREGGVEERSGGGGGVLGKNRTRCGCPEGCYLFP